MAKVLVLHGPRDLRYEDRPTPSPGPNEVRLETRLGAISAGTESAWYFGTDPQLDPSFRPGRLGPGAFPKTLGYEKLAQVVAVGEDVTTVTAGDRVLAYYPHAETWVAPEHRIIAVPDHVSDQQAVAGSLATVALHAVRRSRMQIGDDVIVTGLGFVGLLTVRFARLAGAGRIVATDLHPKRRDLAIRLGADLALDPADADVGDVLRNADGTGPFDVAFETSSSFEALTDAMRSLRRNGRVCVVSQLKGAYPTHPTLGIEFHLDELEMISADGRGDVRKLAGWYFAALERGDLPQLDGLFTHRVPFERIAEGFELIEREPGDVVKILVTYG